MKNNKTKPKADEWYDWITTTSVEATAGLIPNFVLDIWVLIREAILIYLDPFGFSPEGRQQAKSRLKRAAKLVEKVKTWSLLNEGLNQALQL